MTLEERISAFKSLGKYLKEYVTLQTNELTSNAKEDIIIKSLEKAVIQAEIETPWFTRENILLALNNIAISLESSKIDQFTKRYLERLINLRTRKTIGIVMAGNIPAVGFHDFFCVLLAGHYFLGKLSSEDRRLLPAISDILIRINPEFNDLISFTDVRLDGFNAIIATGSNNTHRYFEYYFGKYPNILRKNRNGVAILTGRETKEELSGLADDIFIFFGKGCRSVSKLYLPQGFDFQLLKEPFEKYNHLFNHHKYRNNLDYYKAIYLIDRVPFIDMGQLLLIENTPIASPVSVVHYEYYDDLLLLKETLTLMKDQIQCIVCHNEQLTGSIKPGTVQSPELWDYSDGVDTMEFLMGL
jgi:hypothetical protein